MKNVIKSTNVAADSVQHATKNITGKQKVAVQPPIDNISSTEFELRNQYEDIIEITDAEPAKSSQTISSKSDEQSNASIPSWPEPQTAMEFATQAMKVGTLVLQGQIDIDVARTYSAVARTVAQALGTEVARSRFLKREPNLKFPKLGS